MAGFSIGREGKFVSAGLNDDFADWTALPKVN
jgi:hypothetical protein